VTAPTSEKILLRSCVLWRTVVQLHASDKPSAYDHHDASTGGRLKEYVATLSNHGILRLYRGWDTVRIQSAFNGNRNITRLSSPFP
jgi:hypothetical protein